MNTFSPLMPRRTRAIMVGVASLALALAVAGAAMADTSIPYRATFVEPGGGPVNSPFDCDPGTSCGTANVAGLGHASTVVVFNACGLWCHVRTITFADGSTLIVEEYGPLTDFQSRGNAGSHGYNHIGFAGNPQFLSVIQTITGGTGRFAGATGTATGTLKVAGGAATATVTGSITLP